MANSLLEEILEFTLDQASVQEILVVAKERWQSSELDTINILKELANKNIIAFYEDAQGGGYIDVLPETLSVPYLSSRFYTWFGVTPNTIPELNKLRS